MPIRNRESGRWLAAPPVRIAGTYLALGLLWIWGSDRLLLWLDYANDRGFLAATFKGTLFVGLTAALLYFLVRRDVRASRHTEAALRAERDRFAKLMEAVPVALCSFRLAPDGGVSMPYASPRLEAIYGVPVRQLEVDATPVFDAIHPDDVGRVRAGVAESARTLAVWRDEYRVLSPHRGTIWVEGCSAPLRQPDGSVLWHGCVADITDRHEAEAALRESEERFRATFEQAAVGVTHVGPDGRFLRVNRRFVDITGYSPDELASLTFQRITHPDDLASDEEQVRRLLAGEADSYAMEKRYVRKDGAAVWVNLTVSLRRTADGEPLHFISVIEDVSDRKRAESELRASEARLREQELLLREAGELAHVGGWGFDPVTLRADWTPEVARMYGLDPDAPPAVDRALEFFSPEHRPALEAALATAIRDGTPHDLELLLTTAGGEPRWVRTICRPIVEGGRVVRVRGSLQDITDRRQAEAALRGSEARLAEAQRLARLGSWRWEPPSGRVWWSDALYELFGVHPDAVSPSFESFLERVHPDDRPRAVRRVEEVVAGAVGFADDLRIVRPGGETRWVHSQGRATRDAAGELVSVEGTDQDVTDQKAAAVALQESEERFRNLITFLPDAVYVNAGGRVVFCNPACVRLFGAASADELLGKTPFDLIHPNYHPLIRQRIAAMEATREGVPPVAEEVVRLDGRSVPVFVTALPFRDRNRDAILVVLHDRTEWERATGLLRTVLGSVTDAILTIDARGVVQTASPATERLFGYSEAELVGRNVGVLMPEPDRGRHDEYIRAYLRTGDAKVIGVGREVAALRRDGTTFPAELTVTEFRLDGGRRFTGVIRDVTARKRLEEQFHQAQKMEAIGRLAGGVAHDFNNLLTVINGYSDLTLMSMRPDDPTRESLVAIREAGERAAALTSQLLAFGRKAVVAPQVLDLNLAAAQVERLLRRLIGEDILLTVRPYPLPCWVTIDPNQLDQVILNLAVNARDAMPTGGRLTVSTGVVGERATGRGVELAVTDTGCGMTPDVRERIFEPFFTTKERGKGTGLGLATVFGIVQQAGGRVAVETAVGQGTTFRITFPEVVAPPPAAAVGAATAVRPGTETVLLVEDEDSVREIGRLALEAHGYTVLAASSGREARELLLGLSGPVHLLVTDVVMPEMSGRELADMVRAVVPDIPVLFVSGYADDAVVRHGVQEDRAEFLQKPFSPLGLARKVRAVLDSGS